MKILVGSFQCESNTFAAVDALKDDFEILRGDKASEKLFASKIFTENGFQVIPMLYAAALPSGKVRKKDYLEILSEMLDIARENRDVQGVYLYFHGAMFVEGIGSGEEYCVRQLRKILGGDVPISIASDFHSNISDGLLKNVNAMSGYRTAPHTDYDETEARAAAALIRIIRCGLKTGMLRFKIPMLLADAAVTTKEPYKSVMKMLDTVDKMENVVACSVYNGQPWVDAEYVGASVVISYYGEYDEVYKAGKKIADALWDRRHEFCFDVPAILPDKVAETAKNLQKPVFITDSGDNTTAGAEGKSTFLLQKLINSGLKRVLFAGIFAEEIVNEHKTTPLNTKVNVCIPSSDVYSSDCHLNGILKGRGTILGFVGEEAGEGIIIGTENIDIVLSNMRTSFITKEHFKRMGINPDDYDYIVLKMGYLWPEVEVMAKSTIFALTPGTSTNDFRTLKYNNLKENYFMI